MQNLLTNVLFLILIFTSCFNSEHAPLRSSKKRKRDNCNQANFHNNVLTKKNTLEIFECIHWNEEYPEMVSAIKEISTNEFNLLFSPINKTYFKNKKSTDKLLSIVSQLNTENGFESITNYLRIILEDTQLPKVLKKIIQHDEFKKLVNDLPDEKDFDSLLNILLLLIENTEDSRIDVGKELGFVSKSINDELYISLSESLVLALGNEDVLNVLSRFLYIDKNQNMAVVSKNTSVSALKSCLSFTAIEQPDFGSILSSQLGKRLICVDGDVKFEFDVLKDLNLNYQEISNYNYNNLLEKMIEVYQKIYNLQKMCVQDANTQYFEDNRHLADILTEFSTDENKFFFVKHFLSSMQVNDGLFQNLKKYFESNFYNELNYLASYLLQDRSDLIEEVLKFNKKINPDVFRQISKLLNESKEIRSILNSIGKIYIDLNDSEKQSILKLLKKQFSDEYNLKININFIFSLFNENPLIYKTYKKQLKKLFPKYSRALLKMIDMADDDSVRNELLAFLNSKNLFKLFEIFVDNTKDVYEYELVQAKISESFENNFVREKYISPTKLLNCLEKVNNEIQLESYSYLSMLEIGNECISLDGSSFVSSMFAKINLIEPEIGEFIFSSHGPAAPEFYKTLLTSLIIIKENNSLSTRDEILRIIESVNSFLLDKGMANLMAESLEGILNTEYEGFIRSKLSDFVSLSNDEIQLDIQSLIGPLKDFEMSTHKRKQINSCVDPKDLGVVFCKNELEVANDIIDFIDIISRKHSSKTVYELIIDYFYDERGVTVPRNNNYGGKHVTSIKEIIGYLYDLSSVESEVAVTYHKENSEVMYNLNSLERLEILIRDISFLNNFYGSYFVNKVGSAKNYNNKLVSLKSQARFMKNKGAFFRGIGFYPKKTKWLLKNVMQTFDGLFDVNKQYIQPDGLTRNYTKFVMGLLSMATQASDGRAQKFSAFKKPNLNDVRYHQSKYLVKLVDMSALSHMANYVRSFTNDSISEIYSSEKFNTVNNYFFKKFTPLALKDVAKETFSSNNRENLSSMISEFVSLVKTSDSSRIENIVFNTSYLVSLSTKDNFDKYLEFGTLFVKNWKNLETSNLTLNQKNSITRTIDFALQILVNISKNNESNIKLWELTDNILFKNQNGRNGIDIINDILSSKKSSKLFIDFVINISSRIENLSESDFEKMITELSLLLSNKNLLIDNFLDFLRHSAISDWDNLINLVKYLSTSSNGSNNSNNSNNSNLHTAIQELFVNNKEDLADLIFEMMSVSKFVD